MLSYGELHRIASQASGPLGSYLREDAYQEAWIQFLRWPPPNHAYAWKAATSARNRVYRREQRFQRVKEIDPALFELPQLDSFRETKYWRNPERYRLAAKLRMRRWRAKAGVWKRGGDI